MAAPPTAEPQLYGSAATTATDKAMAIEDGQSPGEGSVLSRENTVSAQIFSRSSIDGHSSQRHDGVSQAMSTESTTPQVHTNSSMEELIVEPVVDIRILSIDTKSDKTILQMNTPSAEQIVKAVDAKLSGSVQEALNLGEDFRKIRALPHVVCGPLHGNKSVTQSKLLFPSAVEENQEAVHPDTLTSRGLPPAQGDQSAWGVSKYSRLFNASTEIAGVLSDSSGKHHDSNAGPSWAVSGTSPLHREEHHGSKSTIPELPALRPVVIKLAVGQKIGKWLHLPLLLLWFLSNVVLLLGISSLRRHMDWDVMSIITATPIFHSSEGIFRYLAFPLSLNQAKGIDFAISAIIAPMVIATANVIWFKLGRTLSSPEEEEDDDDDEREVPTTTTSVDADMKNIEAGTYDMTKISQLLKSWKIRHILFAILLLSSALSSTLLSNTLAYKAIPPTSIEATTTVESEIHYQLVYVPGLLFFAMCNVSIASMASLALVLSARKAVFDRKRQQAADIVKITTAPRESTGTSYMGQMDVKRYFAIKLPELPRLRPLTWHHPTIAQPRESGELEPLLPISKCSDPSPEVKLYTGPKWSFFSARDPSVSGASVNTAENRSSVSASSEDVECPTSDDRSHLQHNNPWNLRLWTLGSLWVLPKSNIMPKTSVTDEVESEVLETLIANISSKVTESTLAEVSTSLETSEIPLVLEDYDIPPPSKFWSWTFKGFRLLPLFTGKQVQASPEIEALNEARPLISGNFDDSTEIPSTDRLTRESTPFWRLRPSFTLRFHNQVPSDIESQAETVDRAKGKEVERNSIEDMNNSASVIQPSPWSLPRFRRSGLSFKGYSKQRQVAEGCDEILTSSDNDMEEPYDILSDEPRWDDLTNRRWSVQRIHQKGSMEIPIVEESDDPGAESSSLKWDIRGLQGREHRANRNEVETLINHPETQAHIESVEQDAVDFLFNSSCAAPSPRRGSQTQDNLVKVTKQSPTWGWSLGSLRIPSLQLGRLYDNKNEAKAKKDDVPQASNLLATDYFSDAISPIQPPIITNKPKSDYFWRFSPAGLPFSSQAGPGYVHGSKAIESSKSVTSLAVVEEEGSRTALVSDYPATDAINLRDSGKKVYKTISRPGQGLGSWRFPRLTSVSVGFSHGALSRSLIQPNTSPPISPLESPSPRQCSEPFDIKSGQKDSSSWAWPGLSRHSHGHMLEGQEPGSLFFSDTGSSRKGKNVVRTRASYPSSKTVMSDDDMGTKFAKPQDRQGSTSHENFESTIAIQQYLGF